LCLPVLKLNHLMQTIYHNHIVLTA